MWLYYCLLSTLINGFTPIAMKKCSNNDKKRIALCGLLSYHFIMIFITLMFNAKILVMLNFMDMLHMLPGIIMQAIGFFCCVSSIKYGKVAITSSIQKSKVVVAFLLGVVILKENCTLLQIIISAILVILSIIIAINKEKNSSKIDIEAQKKSILYSYGFVIFNGISNFLNKIYVANFQDPLYVVFNYAIISIILVVLFCIFTKQLSYIDIRKIKNKKFFFLQSLCDSSSSVFNRFSLLAGDVSIISVIETSSIVVTVLASRLILKEKVTIKKYAMIIGVFICVFILAIIK